MKKASLSLALGLVVALAIALGAPSATATGGALAGSWTSVDTDGSNQTLDITGSGNRVYSVVYYDESATSACDGNPARVSGPGFVDGNELVQVGPIVCLPAGNIFRTRVAIGYVYDPGTDTLTDDFGVVWHRAG